MKLQEKLREARASGNALLATNFYNFETLKGVLNGAKHANSSIILQLSESSLNYMGIQPAIQMARACIEQTGVEAWIHLDHGSSVDLVDRCLKAGVDSVMIDASNQPFEKNVKISSKVVEMARKYDANVEAELGYVAKLGESQSGSYTTPEEARLFVERTGIDALAIAIGSAHGFYKSTPKLALDVLKTIAEATEAVLVLHGSSGIPHDQVQQAIKLGISKINLATEIKDTFMKSLKSILMNTSEIDLRKTFPAAIDDVERLIVHKLEMIKGK